MLTRQPTYHRFAAILLAAFALLSTAQPVALANSAETSAQKNDGKWQWLDDDDGVRIWKLEVPGKDLPGFRGQVTIDASIEDILAEMMDAKHHTDWMYRCKESVVLKEIDDSHAIAYNRTSAPWPVWDRDVILSVGYEFKDDNKHMIMRFQNLDSNLRAKPDDVVRMPLLKGFYKMWLVGPNQTKVLYEIEADIGGSIPKWMAAQASKDLPYITLSMLRDRVMQRAKNKKS